MKASQNMLLNPAPKCKSNGTFRRLGFSVLVSLLIIVPAADLLAGVLTAPTVVIMSDRERTSRMIIRNPSSTPKEIEIRMGFGIPVSDSLGNVNVDLFDTTKVDPRSCADWIKVFPRKLVLAGNGSQTIRFIASPPRGLEDGEYWARVIVKSQESKVNIPTAEEGQITTTLNMIMQTAISLKYRTGDLVSKLAMSDVEATIGDGAVDILMDLQNLGNISYVGRLICRLLDADGNEIGLKIVDLAVYRDLKRKVTIPINVEAAGRIPTSVEVFITDEGRTDIDPKYRIRGNKLEYSMALD